MKRRFSSGDKIYPHGKLIYRKEYQDKNIFKMELHKEIASWLSKFKLIPPNSKALSINSEIEDLVAIIRDGVVLCQVNSIDLYINHTNIIVISSVFDFQVKLRFIIVVGTLARSRLFGHDTSHLRHKCTW